MRADRRRPGTPDLQNLGDRPGALRRIVRSGRGKTAVRVGPLRSACGLRLRPRLSHLETAIDDNDFLQKLAVQRESLRVLDEAVRNSPDNVTLQIYRALVRLRLGDATAAGKVEDSPRLSGFGSDREPSLKLGHARCSCCSCDRPRRLERRHRARRTDAECSLNALHRENPSADAVGASWHARVFGNGLTMRAREGGAAARRPGGRSGHQRKAADVARLSR